jgi:hypothetical protein
MTPTYLVWVKGPRGTKLLPIQAGDRISCRRTVKPRNVLGTVLEVKGGLRVELDPYDSNEVSLPGGEMTLRPRWLVGAWRDGIHLHDLPENASR